MKFLIKINFLKFLLKTVQFDNFYLKKNKMDKNYFKNPIFENFKLL